MLTLASRTATKSPKRTQTLSRSTPTPALI
jgi:hypothetical protein